MPTITGTNGDDTLTGTSGTDLIQGLDGNDNLSDILEGEDTIEGGEGNDIILVSRATDQNGFPPRQLITLDGGAGNDFIRTGNVTGRDVNITGGTGSDRMELFGGAFYMIDAGAEADFIRFDATARETGAIITTGAGADVIQLMERSVAPAIHVPKVDLTIVDFTVGNAGDRISFGDYLAQMGWSENSNPFAGNYFTFEQVGADAVLHVGGVSTITFQNVDHSQLTAFNLDGYASDGSTPVALLLNGGAGADTLSGMGGNDTINGGAGNDVIEGYAGDDDLHGGGDADQINGGLGHDSLFGEGGDDVLSDTIGNADSLYGGTGNDSLIFTRNVNTPPEPFNALLDGGGGDDGFFVDGTLYMNITLTGGIGSDTARIGRAYGTIDLGADDDILILGPDPGDGTLFVTLGAGSDLVTFENAPQQPRQPRPQIQDFQAGNGGDRIDLVSLALAGLPDWDHDTNPFATNQFRLFSISGNTVLGFHGDFSSGDNVQFRYILTLAGVSAGSLTAFNFSGYDPGGAAPAAENFTGGAGADTHHGGVGADTIDGAGGADNLFGGFGNDHVTGGDGDDFIDGEAGSDILEGGADNDFLQDLYQGNDNLSGGTGNDVLTITRDHNGHWLQNNVVMDGGDGDDLIVLNGGSGAAGGGGGQHVNATVTGGIGNDLIRITGMHGGTIDAGSGNDRIEFVLAFDDIGATITLGSGADTILLQRIGFGSGSPGVRTVVDFQTGACGDRIELDGITTYTLQQQGAHTRLIDNNGSVQIVLQNVLASSIGSANIGFRIVGTPGNDSIQGASGTDRMEGGPGDDVYYVDPSTDIVIEAPNEGNDAVYAFVSWQITAGSSVELLSTISHAATDAINLTGNALGQTIVGNAGNNILQGGGGLDLLVGLGGNDIYYTDLATTQIQENAGGGTDTLHTSVSYALSGAEVEILSTNDYGATSAINLTGNALNNTLIGNAGVNILHGGGGVDTLIGLGGNDVYYVDVAATQVIEYEGAGADTVYASLSYTLGGSAEVETLSTNDYASTQAVNLTGNVYGQVLIGNAGANILLGGGGIDTLIGLGGNDIYYVDVAGTQAYEAAGAGTDTLYTSVSYALAAGSEVETLSSNDYGATSAINLAGNASAQTVTGNAGANTVNGGAGADVLYGLGGADNFAFTTALGGGNVDYIADFSTVADTIQLDDAIFTAIGGTGALNPNAFVTGAAAADADDRIVYNSATGQLFYDADGNGAGAAVQFATLAGNPALTASDFQVI